ncbi:unnamed protein product [Arabidopsis halleri]
MDLYFLGLGLLVDSVVFSLLFDGYRDYVFVGKSTLACSLNQKLYQKRKLCYNRSRTNTKRKI